MCFYIHIFISYIYILPRDEDIRLSQFNDVIKLSQLFSSVSYISSAFIFSFHRLTFVVLHGTIE